jgi:hypothetical protein
MPHLTHVVLFKFTDSFVLEEAAEIIKKMKETIPGMLSLEFGAVSKSPFDGYQDVTKDHTHTLVSTHVDGEALKAYHEHPDHLLLVQYCVPRLVEGGLTMTDFYTVV